MNSKCARLYHQADLSLFADKFAASLGYKDQLCAALIKLQIKNLSSPHYDWLYSAWNHSHPTLGERLKAIEDYAGSAPLQVKPNEKKEL